MRHTKFSKDQIAANGFTDLFVVLAADMTSFSATNITLDGLAVGDVLGLNLLVEVKTAVAGPSGAPTAQIVESGGSGTMTSTFNPKTATYVTPAAANVTLAITTAGNLQLALLNGGGDGAAASAGEIWIWCSIYRKGERTTEA